ncbi:MAG: hypothetical protein ACT4OU_00850 [Hyphomicrobium sp.]
MWDAFQELTNVSTFTWAALLLMTGSICWFLKEIVGAPGLAMLFAPFIMLGGLLSTHLFSDASILLSPDKNTNATSTAAIGIFGALIAMIVVYCVWARISEARVKARKVPDALSDPSAR